MVLTKERLFIVELDCFASIAFMFVYAFENIHE